MAGETLTERPLYAAGLRSGTLFENGERVVLTAIVDIAGNHSNQIIVNRADVVFTEEGEAVTEGRFPNARTPAKTVILTKSDAGLSVEIPADNRVFSFTWAVSAA